MSSATPPPSGPVDGLLGDAIRQAQEAAPDRLIEALSATWHRAGLHDAVLYLVDHQNRTLTPVTGSERDSNALPVLPIDGSVAGDVFRTQVLMEASENGGKRLFLPVSESRCRLGVLSVAATDFDDHRRRASADLAEVIAQLVRTRQQYTDCYLRARRREPMALAAELQWSLLPPLDFSCEAVTVAGLVEPAYHIGGDVFDYAVNGDVVHFGIVDSMGHALHSAIVAGLVIGTYRNRRRAGADLVDTIEALDGAVAEQFGGERFATVGLGELDTRRGVLRWVNGGHPLPLILRGDEIRPLSCPPRLPVGLGGDPATVCDAALEPGDRVICFSDGITEAMGADGRHFGEARLEELLRTGSSASAAELVHAVVAGAVEHQGGEQRDDATMLLVELGRPGTG